jgi:hypothetical protein
MVPRVLQYLSLEKVGNCQETISTFKSRRTSFFHNRSFSTQQQKKSRTDLKKILLFLLNKNLKNYC